MADDFCDVFEGKGLHIDLICDEGIGHDGCGVAVAKNNFIAFFFKCEACLGSRVVKFRSLADYDRAGADDEDFFDVRSFCHSFSLSFVLYLKIIYKQSVRL